MYCIDNFTDTPTGLPCFQISNEAHSVTIVPELGAAILKLTLSNQIIINTPAPINTPGLFAGAILFPFANRVAKGRYFFDGKHHQLLCNDNTGNNALHGLVYNQPFTVLGYNLHKTHATISLGFEATAAQFVGFPFAFGIVVHYTLSANRLEVRVVIENRGEVAFPYQLGWHPYFYAPLAQERYILLNASGKFIFDEAKLPSAFVASDITKLQINTHYDDCYALLANDVIFKHGSHTLRLFANTGPNYLQVFTPTDKNLVAIEFMSAPPNCFNTGRDVLVLPENAKQEAGWGVQFSQSEV